MRLLMSEFSNKRRFQERQYDARKERGSDYTYNREDTAVLLLRHNLQNQ